MLPPITVMLAKVKVVDASEGVKVTFWVWPDRISAPNEPGCAMVTVGARVS